MVYVIHKQSFSGPSDTSIVAMHLLIFSAPGQVKPRGVCVPKSY
jgi:hypothetical protein